MNRQLRELNEHIRSINGELRDANNIKDEYVGHYLPSAPATSSASTTTANCC